MPANVVLHQSNVGIWSYQNSMTMNNISNQPLLSVGTGACFVQNRHSEWRPPRVEFFHPLMHHCRWADNESGAKSLEPVIWTASPDLAVAQTCQEGNYLDGLAQSHFVSQNSSCLLAVQFPQPPNTCLLIPTTTNTNKERENGKWWVIQTVTESTHELIIWLGSSPVREACRMRVLYDCYIYKAIHFWSLRHKNHNFCYRMLTRF